MEITTTPVPWGLAHSRSLARRIYAGFLQLLSKNYLSLMPQKLYDIVPMHFLLMAVILLHNYTCATRRTFQEERGTIQQSVTVCDVIQTMPAELHSRMCLIHYFLITDMYVSEGI